MNSWQLQQRDPFVGYRWLKMGIKIPRDRLYERINQRVDEMFESGLLDEAQGLLQKFPKQAHAFKAIGYRQAVDYLEGSVSLPLAIEETKKESRHYAKRQLTWFRSDHEIVWLDGNLDPAKLQEGAAQLISQWLVVSG